jgi:ABC-type Fe3+/spermidine/putrescine transport system ATPase subunit
MSEVLNISNLGQSFGGTSVLSGVNLAVQVGERLVVIGSSGSGKTTLLRLIAGLEPPTAGQIMIAGTVVSRAGEVVIAPENRQVAMVFQGLALFPNLRALDQIAFAAKGRGGVNDAKSLLDRIGLGHRAHARLDELSGGERQRIALARAIAQRPKLILMDEPFSSLDDEKRAEMRDLLRHLLESTETTLILVTHSRTDALDLARQVLVLDHGKPVVQGSLESIIMHPHHPAAVRAFGLGQIVEGEFTAANRAATAFGSVSTTSTSDVGSVRLLIRPAQPRIVLDGDGVDGVVVRLELQPPETSEIRRIAVVHVEGNLLRVLVRDIQLSPGDRVRIRIEGDCDQLG